MEKRQILALDFDGVLHNYTSGWQGPTIIPDGPVPGGLAFVEKALQYFDVAIYSSRMKFEGGLEAIHSWMKEQGFPVDKITFSLEKPPAFIFIDDRAFTFQGIWPEIGQLQKFRPWNGLATPCGKKE